VVDLFDNQRLRIERRAMEIWREREMQFPQFVRRTKPDDLDRASGAWDRALMQAAAEVDR
jgi:hypothetical protein